MTCTTTPATASRSTETTLREDHDTMTDYYARTLAIAAGLIPEVYRQRQPRTARACHNGRKPKGPMLENISGSAVAAPTDKRGFVMSEFVRPALARAGMVAGRMGLPVRMAARLIPCFQHPAHPRSVKTARVAFESRSGAETMTQAYATLARTAAPIIPASPAAAPIRPQADTTDPQIIALYAQAENALAGALHLLRSLDCDPAKLQQATGRAIRAATMLKRLSAAQVKEVAA